MHRARLATCGTVIVAVFAACTDAPRQVPTAPPSAALLATTTACSQTLARQIASEQNDLFKASVLTAARNQWAPVVQDCSTNPAQAKQEMLAYVQFTIDTYRQGNVQSPKANSTFTSAAQALVSHWSSVFVYVGFADPSQSPLALGADGAAAVFDDATGGDLINGSKTAAVRIPANAPQDGVGKHLYTIAPLDSGCLSTPTSQANLAQSGRCFEISASPVTTFDPQVIVAICQPLRASEAFAASAALAHLVDGVMRVTQPAANPFAGQICLSDEAAASRRVEPSARGWIGATWFALGRAGSRLADLLSPEPLYAIHGGLSGSSTKLSPFGAVDKLIFAGTFTNDAAGQPPASTLTAPDKGTWMASATAPGTILVQSSIGDLTEKPVVLDQAGGNCATCGGLEFRGTVANAAGTLATTGTYVVRWESLEDKPSVKAAPFVIRDSQRNVLAVLSYRSSPQGQNILSYDGTDLPWPQFQWVQSTKQRFAITVDLDHKTTTLAIDGVVARQGAPYVNTVAGAQDLRTVAAEFSSIDSGIIGWDNITVTRLPDP